MSQHPPSLTTIRNALVAALALVDRLEDPRHQPIDERVRDLLLRVSAKSLAGGAASRSHTKIGLSTRSICSLIRRRNSEVVSTLRLMERAGQISRNSDRLWVITSEDADAQENKVV